MNRKLFQKLAFTTAGATALSLGTAINSLPASAASFTFRYFGDYDWGTGSLTIDDASLSATGSGSLTLSQLSSFTPNSFNFVNSFVGGWNNVEPRFEFTNGNLVGIRSYSITSPPNYNWFATRAEWFSQGGGWSIGCAGRWSAIELCNLIASRNMYGIPVMGGLIEFQTVTAWQGNVSQPPEPQPPQPQPPQPPKSVPEPKAMGGLALVALGFLAKKIVSQRRAKSSQVS